MLNVQVVLFDGFDLLDVIGPYEVFCAAAIYTDNAFNVELVSVEGQRSVPSGIKEVELAATGRLNPDMPGIIVIPGASGEIEGDGPDSIPSILGRVAKTELTSLASQALERDDVIVATVCGGSLILAMAGLLEGRPAVTNRLGMGLLGATGAIPIPARVVDDGNVVSGGGVTSGLDVALHLVERTLGPRITHEIEQLFEFERRGTVWQKSGMAPKQFLVPTGHESSNTPETVPLLTPDIGNHNNLNNHSHTPASIFDGDWETTIATPVGKMLVRLSISTRDGVIQGTATQGEEQVAFINPVLQNNKLIWSLRITKPMRLNLKFEVSADGDRMTGMAKAGILPSSQLSGVRTARSISQ